MGPHSQNGNTRAIATFSTVESTPSALP